MKPYQFTLIRKLAFPYQCCGLILFHSVVVSSKVFCYTNNDHLYELLWLANRQKYSLLATSTTSWFLRVAPGTTLRNRVIVLLAAKAGLRAGEIANLTWDMVLDPTGGISSVIELRDIAAKNGSGRLIPVAPRTSACPRCLSQSFDRQRPGRSIRAWRSDDAIEHRGLVQPRIPEHRSAWLLLPFRTPHVHHPGGAVGSSGRWLAARRPIASRPSVDPNHPTVHRRRHRCPAEAGRHDLTA